MKSEIIMKYLDLTQLGDELLMTMSSGCWTPMSYMFNNNINIPNDIRLSLDVLVFIGIRTSNTMTRTCKILVYT